MARCNEHRNQRHKNGRGEAEEEGEAEEINNDSFVLFGLVQAVRQDVQAVVDAIDAFIDSLGHAAVPVPILRQAIPSKVRHEEAHLHPHR